MPLLCNFRRDGLHFPLNLGESLMRHAGNPRGWNVQAKSLQSQRVLFWRKTKIASRLGQNVGAIPHVVVSELRLQSCKGLLPSFEFVLLEKGGNSIQIVRVSTQFCLDLHTRWIDDARFGHLVDHALLHDLRNRLIRRFQTRIRAKARDGGWPTFGGRLSIEQNAEAAEDIAARIEKR